MEKVDAKDYYMQLWEELKKVLNEEYEMSFNLERRDGIENLLKLMNDIEEEIKKRTKKY